MANGLGVGPIDVLKEAQRLREQRNAQQPDLLKDIIQGIQTGATLRNFPEQLRQQRLAQQLAVELQQERVADLRDPTRAIMREIQRNLALRAIDPTSGISAALPGLEGETLAAPGAITPEQQLALEAGGIPPPPVSPGVPIAPIKGIGGQPTGFTFDPSVSRAAKQQALGDEIAKLSARYSIAGVPTRQIVDEFGNIQVVPTRMFGGEAPVATNVTTETGAPLKGQTKPTKGLTANQQSSLRLRGGRSLVNINDYTDPKTGQVDWDTYATKVGEAEGNKLHSSNLIKDARASTKTTLDEKNLQLYGNRMDQANEDFDKLTEVGFDPTSIGTEGLLGGWVPNLLKTNQRQQFEQAERNFINASLRRESGAVITDDEFANARQQYFPQPGDGQPVLDQKEANRKLVIDEFRRLGGQAATLPPAIITIRTKEERDALPAGTRYIGPDGITSIKR